ncbi:thioesterase [Pedobacter kyungheensis]|uniref:Acyl-CoA thioester hydrolase n=2 Tax=Pedobacter TaxID=84567 RepID=A0A1G6SU40_9SPHI|nr:MULTISPECIES: thioesterase family protein [Pedobacter]KIA95980.1 thioesterase [Pedobacter kyungheensis]RQO73386.1 acyl-CoA thioesterase [Pedobacter sp. KBW01]SDD20450.1 acyl-CoA thioester hydrolase [Pedobacter soli]
MYSHSTKIRVRYGETDQMGYMYYGNYAQYYEVGRVEMLRSLGMSYSSMEADGIMMPVLELKCKYIKPALYDQEITVKTIIKTLPGIRIFFEYELYNEKEELINLGATTLVFVDMKKNKPTNPPENFMEKLSVFFN